MKLKLYLFCQRAASTASEIKKLIEAILAC